ncbi:hypothetical protein [Thermomonospora cellulosilytica]|uniref:DUF3592 domain-containing protein n=1 Tax=Thermomonospora cellulosilytica TaxID=1411118 RepID=A0A7W3N136_9ACTN|nr:hypothetical protein [Thermomonospora cellulosilytica]MBA9005592.1 hypothetical protein [Thermomonospora cellulosilytica]
MLIAVLVAVALYLLYLALPNLGPALRAARLDGTAGTFTAQRLQCVRHPGHESCSWQGTFVSDDGAVRREGVWLHGSDRSSHQAGQRTRAYDTGRESRVYGPGGSREWVPIALMVAVSGALLAFAFSRPRERRDPGAGEPVPPLPRDSRPG